MSKEIKEKARDFDCRAEVERVLGQPTDGRGATWTFTCPFHAERTPGAFKVWKDGYKCFSCGERGDVFDWFAYSQNRPLADVLKDHNYQPPDPAVLEARRQAQAEALAAEIERAQAVLDELRRAEVWTRYHDALDDEYRAMWRKRGIPDAMQNYWQLGRATWHNSPTLTIPIYQPGWQVANVKHRLLDTNETGGKYRYETAGLPARPFLCDPDNIQHENILVVEGEIKAMVVYTAWDKAGWQVIGLAGKSTWQSVADELQGRQVVIVPDPDAGAEGEAMARQVGARLATLPTKIDDLIVAHGLGRVWVDGLIKSARKV